MTGPSPEGGSVSGGPSSGAIGYGLGVAAAARRSAIAAGVAAATGLAPLVLSGELLSRLLWRLPPAFWAVVVGAGALVVVRAGVQFWSGRRRLAALRVVVDDASIAAVSARAVVRIARADVAKIVEVDGPLGGIRV
ncbi:MAG: hypothetical protein FWD17_01440, partial [Polyangiaceae bacterium]|nr:hypothetical protein [Polyangiaceae bacterium]